MEKHGILIVGAGKIGSAVASLLAQTKDYQVFLGDVRKPAQMPIIAENPVEFIVTDITKPDAIIQFVKSKNIKAVVSCLPFHLTLEVAKIASVCGIDYFDPTEDVAITDAVTTIAKTSKGSFAPQCGLAPGFISIAANSLMHGFDSIETVKMRVGALTQNVSNSLSYALTWSIDGLVNEYLHPCRVIEDGEAKLVPALGGLETIMLENCTYEAFHTSGGAGSLVDTYKGKVKNLDYKTMRYPGHCEKMSFLIKDLQLGKRPELIKEILSGVIPHAQQDKVLVYVSVEGIKNGQLQEINYSNTLLPQEVEGNMFTAIQMTTATGICTLVDMVVHEKKLSGLVKQEDVTLDSFLKNRFGKYYARNTTKAKHTFVDIGALENKLHGLVKQEEVFLDNFLKSRFDAYYANKGECQ